MNVYSDDKVKPGHLYRMEIYFPDIADISAIDRGLRKLRIKNKLIDEGLACRWEFEFKDTDTFTYCLINEVDLTHHNVFEAVESICDKAMRMDWEDLGEGRLSDEHSNKDSGSLVIEWFEKNWKWFEKNWELFGGLFLLPYLIFKGKDFVEWWQKKKLEILIGTGVGLLLIVWVVGYINRPTVIIKK